MEVCFCTSAFPTNKNDGPMAFRWKSKVASLNRRLQAWCFAACQDLNSSNPFTSQVDRDHDPFITTKWLCCERLNMFSSISSPFLNFKRKKSPGQRGFRFVASQRQQRTWKRDSSFKVRSWVLEMDVRNPALFSFHFIIGVVCNTVNTVSSPKNRQKKNKIQRIYTWIYQNMTRGAQPKKDR